VKFYRNTGTAAAPTFVAADGVTVINPMAGFDVGSDSTPAFADIDNDGDLDLFVGEINGTVKFYRNDGTASAPVFVAADGVTVINPLNGFDVGLYAVPTFADIDNDGDLDAFVGGINGTVKFFENLDPTPGVAAGGGGSGSGGGSGGGGGGGCVINPGNQFDPLLPFTVLAATVMAWARRRRCSE
jgi:hypothetical protein